MIICSVNHIAKSFGGNLIFKDLSLEINEGKRVGLVGRNGCGKTTLMRLLAGEETVDEGVIHWKKGLKIGYLAQIPHYENMTVNQVLKTAFQDLVEIETKLKSLEIAMSSEIEPSILERLINEYGKFQDQFTLRGGYDMDFELDRVSQGLNITGLSEKPFMLLSGGEKTKVGLALSLLKKPELLLLDEPTNHLDLMAVEWLGTFLKEYEGTIILISHDRYFLDEVVTNVLDMEDGEIELYHTNFSDFVKSKEEKLLREFQEYHEQQKKIKKMKEAIKRLRDWANRSNPPSSALHKRATNMQRALDRMEKLDRPKLDTKKMLIDFEANDRSGKDVVVMKDVSKRFGDRTLFEGVDIHVQYKERVAIVGENGTGKSTLIKLILHEVEADSGIVKVGSNAKTGYLSQHVFQGVNDERVIDVFRSAVTVNEGEARHILAKFLFYGPAVFRKVNQLSGGERMRLRLAQLMYSDINFLILDEPTNHLDIDSCEVLEEALDGFNGTILAVSHDRYFLNKLFKKTYWIQNGNVLVFDGNYEWARKKLDERNTKISIEEPIKRAEPKTVIKKQREQIGKGADEIEADLEKLEATILKLQLLLEKEAELQKIQDLYKELEDLEKQRDDLYDQLDVVS
ncbi:MULTISPECIES: ribosomal protection-like ABC-F family protein [unclassified Bacillus (in: firmicutes)]|uniref:ribosomal protection-like ABC-F family protein n=1 Tax=unclassified Bacillus (in: firmicutes) TaxID=185979 RepID=UPI0008E7D88D|nr:MULTISPECIES: ABC-F type ribosomal protection protein [unclassified Bacillus (in: firmicutes)]SFA90904.1 ATPase components of ABC transporters with duplicated ATPase domains [Bacillus sp. UNCCL13]SFQ85428.1 ATPase components of ABC transporters with duplicated ATPase domains [Bacillus sp. cl95]